MPDFTVIEAAGRGTIDTPLRHNNTSNSSS
jgi:hypothetical protein